MSSKRRYGIPLVDRPAVPSPEHMLDAAFKAYSAGRHAEAAGLAERVLQTRPRNHTAVQILGVARYKCGDVAGALDCFETAVALEPTNADGYNNLGNVLAEIGRYDESVERLQRAVELSPSLASARSNLGRVLGELGRHDEAIEEAQQACRLDPSLAEAYVNLGKLLMDLGLTEEALTIFAKALEVDPRRPDAHANYLMCLQYVPGRSEDELLRAAKRWAAIHAPVREPLCRAGNREPGARLRIGYVSGDLRAHPVGYTMERLIPNHDRGRFEIFCYSNWPAEDEVTARLRASSDGWRNICGLSDDDAAKLICADGIDALIDLSGHSALNRLGVFARKPAPVQATWLGYFATTGMPQMDYILRDRAQIPECDESRYVERVAVLPDDLFCYAPPHEEVPVAPLPMLRNGYATFGSFNNLSKLNRTVAALWSQVLHSVPNSKLLVNRAPLRSEIGRQVVSALFAEHGICAERLILTSTQGRESYLRSYGEVDVVLDTFPFNGATTTYESLWMGVPVVTRTWPRMVGRFGESILRGVGLHEWIARDDRSFVEVVRGLVSDPAGLARIRAALRERFTSCPLCVGERFARAFEDVVVRMVEGAA